MTIPFNDLESLARWASVWSSANEASPDVDHNDALREKLLVARALDILAREIEELKQRLPAAEPKPPTARNPRRP
jgi:hypothetical protein